MSSDLTFSIAGAQLATNLLVTDDEDDNLTALITAIRSVDQHEQMAVLLAAARLLAHQIRQTAAAQGQLDELIETAYSMLAAYADQESQP